MENLILKNAIDLINLSYDIAKDYQEGKEKKIFKNKKEFNENLKENYKFNIYDLIIDSIEIKLDSGIELNEKEKSFYEFMDLLK